MPTPSAPEQMISATLDFAADGQSMWASGPALTVNYSLPLVGFSTGNIPLTVAGVTLNANLAAELVASLQGTAGGISVDYPVNATISAPSVVAPGQQFTVDTADLGLVHSGASISTSFPSFSAGLDLVVSGGASASGSLNILGAHITVLNTSGSFSSDISLASVSTSNVSVTAPVPNGSITFQLPTSESSPSTVVGGGSLLPTIGAFESAAPDVVSATTDLAADIASMLDLSDFTSASFLDGEISYYVASAPLNGTIDFVQSFTFVPSGVSVDITAPWGQSEIVPLGGKATFAVPEGYTGSTNLSASYILSGNLESQNGISGGLSVSIDLLSASAFGYSAGPAYSNTFSVGTGPLYLYSPGGSAGFPLDNIALQSATSAGTISTTLEAAGITVPGGGTVTLATGSGPTAVPDFSADATALIQSGVDKVSGSLTATNIYNGSGTATSAVHKLNIEVTSATGALQLPAGFLIGILEPASADATLTGNATDVLLAAAPGSGALVFDTLITSNNHDTLVGAQSGIVDFEIKSGFSGEIGGVVLGDTIDLLNVASASPNASLNSSTNVLTVSDGGHAYAIKLDPQQDLSDEVFTFGNDGSGGTDIFFGNVFANGTTFTVDPGITVSDFVMLTGAQLRVSSGGTAIDTVLRGGVENVYASGSAVSTTVDAGFFNVSSGGHASSTVVNSGAAEVVFSGGADVSATVSSGGHQYVLGGATATGATVAAGATQLVSSGGVVSNTTVGGSQLDYGSTVSTHLLKGGSETVFSGGAANNTTVSAGGVLTVSSGGTELFGQLSAGATLTVLAHGSAFGGFDSGQANISGTATDLGAATGGTEQVFSGALTVSNIVDSRGTLLLSKGAAAQDTQVEFGGVMTVSSGATVTATSDGGNENLYGTDISGVVGPLDSTTTHSSFLNVFSGGTASQTQIMVRADVVVHSGGRMISPQIFSAGTLELQSGAKLSGTVDLVGGTLQIDATTMPTNVISGLFDVDGNAIDLRGVAPQSGATVAVVNGTHLKITEGGHPPYSLAITSTSVSPATNNLPQTETVQIGPDGRGGSLLTMLGGSGEELTAESDSTLYLLANDTVGAIGASNTTIYATSGDRIYGGAGVTINLAPLTSGGVEIFNPVGSGTTTHQGSTVSASVPTVHDTVIGFQEGIDFVHFGGMTSATVSDVVATANTVSGNTTVSFTDHSTITFTAISHVAADFFK